MSQTTPRLPSSPTRWAAIALIASLTAGCSALQEDKIDYQSARKGNTLDVPPDLTQLNRDVRFQVPGSVVTASGYQTTLPAAAAGATTATNAVGDVRIERSGSQRWLVVDRPADKLWTPIRDFWQESGFVLELDQEKLGIMETDWAENRAKLPQDIIRRTIGRVFENLYSTGERDKFRTRLERSGDGKTEIFISHRGMIEVYSSAQKDQTVWQPRDADPELEAEFLSRLMVKLGVSEAQAQAAVASAPVQEAARLTTVNGQPVIELGDGFDRAWRRVGLSLDRSGFTVEDRDRSQGIYFVRYVAPSSAQENKPGFFGRMFSGAQPDAVPARYRVVVVSQNNRSTVSVLDAQGQAETTGNAARIAQLLVDDLK